MPWESPRARKWRRIGKAVIAIIAIPLPLLCLAQLPFVFRRFYTYPRTQSALNDIEHTRRPMVARGDGLNDFRGVMHVHTHLSHDSMGTAQEVITAAQRAGLDFVFTTDHYGWQTDAHVVREALRGNHGGVFFVAGAEMRDGVMPFFLDRPPERYNPHMRLQAFVDELRGLGAVVFLTHPDDLRRRWDLKGWTGMEIYNLHADARKTGLSIYSQLSEHYWSMQRYPMRVYHRLFHEPVEYLDLWDRFTTGRRVVGIAGNDAHQNQGIRLIATERGSIVLTDTSGADKPFWELDGATVRWLGRTVFGELTPGRTLWRTDADLYERTFRYVTTHLLARDKTESDLRHALENGHAYVAFDSLVDASGFDFSLASGAIMGDEVSFRSGLILRVATPVDATIRLIRGGVQIAEQRGRELSYAVREPGVYRAEAHLTVRSRLLPWIYSNPIYIR